MTPSLLKGTWMSIEGTSSSPASIEFRSEPGYIFEVHYTGGDRLIGKFATNGSSKVMPDGSVEWVVAGIQFFADEPFLLPGMKGDAVAAYAFRPRFEGDDVLVLTERERDVEVVRYRRVRGRRVR